MKGATAEPWVSATRVPNSTSTATIGPSHHFFLSRMNAHSSDRNELLVGGFFVMVSSLHGCLTTLLPRHVQTRPPPQRRRPRCRSGSSGHPWGSRARRRGVGAPAAAG